MRGRRQRAVVVPRKEHGGIREFTNIAEALRAPRILRDTTGCRQGETCQDGNDGHCDEQLDEGEGADVSMLEIHGQAETFDGKNTGQALSWSVVVASGAPRARARFLGGILATPGHLRAGSPSAQEAQR